MKILTLTGLVSTSILMVACGGGGNSATIPNGNGGSTTVTQGGGGGKAIVIKDIVATNKCSSTVLKGDDADTTVTEYVGSSGSIETPCTGSDEYRLKSGLTNLNLKSMIIEEFWYCKNAKGDVITSMQLSQDLGKGKSSVSWTADGTGEYLKCTGTFPSPLPKTISSSQSIDNLIDYWDDQNYENNNCVIGTGSTNNNSPSQTCDSGWTFGKNITFIDDRSGVHKTTRKVNWFVKKH